MRGRWRAVAAISGSLALVGTAAGAATHTGWNVGVSCDTAYTTSLVTLWHASGDLKYKQTDTQPALNSYAWALGIDGNTQLKAVVDGNTVTWFSMRASNYTFKTRPVSNTNCNGSWPGNGNSELDFTAYTSQ